MGSNLLVHLHLTRRVRSIVPGAKSSILALDEVPTNRKPRSVQVNIPAESGEMGILAQHVPSIEQLKPGLVEIIEESGGNKQFFRTCSHFGAHHFLQEYLQEAWKANFGAVSGGFAVVQPNSVLSINAVEGFPVEEFSEEAVKSQIQEAQKVASGSGSEQDIAEAKIELEVRNTLRTCRSMD